MDQTHRRGAQRGERPRCAPAAALAPALVFALSASLSSVAAAQATFMPYAGRGAVEPPGALLATWGTPRQCDALGTAAGDDMPLQP